MFDDQIDQEWAMEQSTLRGQREILAVRLTLLKEAFIRDTPRIFRPAVRWFLNRGTVKGEDPA